MFVQTIEYVDISRGKQTPGAQGRGPEIYIPITARRLLPDFWGWPEKYRFNSKGIELERYVKIAFQDQVATARLWGYHGRTEFRLANESIQSAFKEPGDIMLISEGAEGADYDYVLMAVKKDNPSFAELNSVCTIETPVANSIKRFNFLDSKFDPVKLGRRFWVLIVHDKNGPDYTYFKDQKKADGTYKQMIKDGQTAELLELLEQVDLTISSQRG